MKDKTSHGFCQCGCGEKTNLHYQSICSNGVTKGQPRDYVKGHQFRNKPIKFAPCHPDRKVKANGMCGSCYNKFLDNRDPEKKEMLVKKRNLQNKARYLKRNKEKYSSEQRNRMLMHRYGITQPDYDALLFSQDGSCAICDKKPTTQPLFVDHCHTTKRVRGLLCPKCNSALGVIDMGQQYVDKLIKYIGDNKAEMVLGPESHSMKHYLNEVSKC